MKLEFIFVADSPLDREYVALSCGFHCCSSLALLSEYVRVPHEPMLGYSLWMVHGFEALNLDPSLPAFCHFGRACVCVCVSVFNAIPVNCLFFFFSNFSLDSHLVYCVVVFSSAHTHKARARKTQFSLFTWIISNTNQQQNVIC